MSEEKEKLNKQFRTIQVTLEQYEACRAVQSKLQNDPRYHGFIPTIHHIARTMIDKGLEVWREQESN